MPLVGVAVIGATMASSWPDVDQRVKFLRHRTVTHYPALQLAFFALIALAGAAYAPEFAGLIAAAAAAMAFGCVMHSAADAMTVDKHGIQLLWPLSRRGYHLLPWSLRVWVGSKSRSERAFVAIWCAFVLIYAYARFGHLISS
jgi:membrane-bound metal-dependent hydrolase YbcI (DUF457 family)